MNLENISTLTRQQSAEPIKKQKRFHPNNSHECNTITYLTSLPDELWLLVLSYLNTVDIFRTFDGLNQRFNNIIYDCARCMVLPSDVTDAWLEQYVPQIEYRARTLCLNEEFLQRVFANTGSFPNLQLINLQGNGWNMTLRTREKPVSVMLMSSLNFLQDIDSSDSTFSLGTQNNVLSDEDNYWKTFSCPFIERLSIETCSVQELITKGARVPNLIHLNINYLHSERYDVHLIDKVDLINRTTRLVTLNITTAIMENFNILEQLIKCFQTSLKNLTLNVHFSRPVDGHHLEEIFKSCQQLKKLAFFFRYDNKQVNINDCRRSFQSEWWLHAHRPLIYMQHNDQGDIIIISMPCHFSFAFKKNDLVNWYINKGNPNSSYLRFDNIKKIHLTNDVHRSISLECLYSIDRIFPSSNKCLCVDFCDLESVDTIFDLLMEDTSMAPVLPNVNHFIVGSKNKLDSLMLCVWILLAPNLEKLDLSNLTVFNQIELAKELSDMINDDERLKPKFDHINELINFAQRNDVDTKTKKELSVAFRKVFIHLNIS